MNNPILAIRTTRRHWADLEMNKPTQNWLRIPDHQLRIVRNLPNIQYKSDVKMHERLIDLHTGRDPVHAVQDDFEGLFHDHHHCYYRALRPNHKEHNEQNYSKLVRGEQLLENPIK